MRGKGKRALKGNKKNNKNNNKKPKKNCMNLLAFPSFLSLWIIRYIEVHRDTLSYWK